MANLKELLGDAYKEGMTFSEIETAFADRKLADLTSGEYVSKGKLTDYEKRAKELERKLQEKMTEEEKAQAENLEKENRYKQIERENSIIKTRSKLSSTIKDEKLLDEVAQLYADGNVMEALEKTNAYHATSRAELEKQIKAELLAKNPMPLPDGSQGKETDPFIQGLKGE